MPELRPYCLTIAGFDPSGGAGVLADIKTFEQHEVIGLAATTAITHQNDSEFAGVEWLATESIIRQLEPLKKFPVSAVKIGLVKDLSTLTSLVEWVKDNFSRPRIIWDPILKASAGFRFHEGMILPVELLQKMDLITPNLPEYKELVAAGLSNTATSLLIKGGHCDSKPGTDVLVENGSSVDIEATEFLSGKDKHGTGCVLSSAITAQLAKGCSLQDSCRKAKMYIEKYICSNGSRLGYHKP